MRIAHGHSSFRRQPLPHRRQCPIHQPGAISCRWTRTLGNHRRRTHSTHQIPLWISAPPRHYPHPLPRQPHRTQRPCRPPLRHLNPTHLSPHPPLCHSAHGTRRKRAMSRLTPSCWIIRTRSCPKFLFSLFSLIALLLLHRAQKTSTLSTLAFAIIAIIAAYYIRSAGIILIATSIIFFALHKKWKETGLIAVGSLLLALPWQIRNASLGGTPYIKQLLSINPYRPEEGALTFATLIERILTNFELYGLQIIPYIFLPSFIDTNYFVGLVFSGLLLYVLITGLIKRHLLIVYLTCYLGLYILWPDMWSDTRFLIPVIPILFYAILTSMDELLQLLARALKKTASRARTVIFFLFLLGSNIFETNELAKHIGQLPPQWNTYFAAAEWIKDNTESDVKIACRKPYLMNAIANRKATGYAWKTPDEVIAEFEQKGHRHRRHRSESDSAPHPNFSSPPSRHMKTDLKSSTPHAIPTLTS